MSKKYQENYNADLKFGVKSETKVLKILKNCLGEHIKKSRKQYSILDFFSNKYKVKAEVKGRRNTKDYYPTTMIGENKILEAERLVKAGYEVFIFFDFTDKLCYFKMTEFNKLRSYKNMGGTLRRGIKDKKLYRYINIDDLTDYDPAVPIDYIKTERRVSWKENKKSLV